MAVQRINKALVNQAKRSTSKLVIDNLEPIIDKYVNSGELTIIESRPAVGKTSYMLNIVAQMLKAGKRVLLVSLELYASRIVGRLLPLFDNEKQFLESQLIIDDSTCMDVDSLINHECINDIDLIAIDYLGLLNLTNDSKPVQRDFGYILNSLKQLSVEKQIPVLAAAQISERAKEHPHFKEADNTIMLYRDSVFEKNVDVNRIIESRVSKAEANTEDRFNHHFGDWIENNL